jgi:hypothetical protein
VEPERFQLNQSESQLPKWAGSDNHSGRRTYQLKSFGELPHGHKICTARKGSLS